MILKRNFIVGLLLLIFPFCMSAHSQDKQEKFNVLFFLLERFKTKLCDGVVAE
jgi:hypothetical protein